MTKYKRHKKTNKRSQRGGDLTSWFTGTSSTASGYGESYSEKAKKAYNNSMASLGSWVGSTPSSSSSYTSSSSSYTPSSSSTSSSYTPASAETMTPTTRPDTTGLARGGRKRRKMRGGKGGLGLTYYATPVSGLNVAKPTYWIPNQSLNGGSRRKRRQRKSRKSKKSRKSRKSKKTRRH